MKTARIKTLNEFVNFSSATRKKKIKNSFVNGAPKFLECMVMARKRQAGLMAKVNPAGKGQIVN
jgi:hypothetical protein